MWFFILLSITALLVPAVLTECGSGSDSAPVAEPSQTLTQSPTPTQTNPPPQSPTPTPTPTPAPTPTPTTGPTPNPGPSATPVWHTLYEEHFETLTTLFENGVPGSSSDGFQLTDR